MKEEDLVIVPLERAETIPSRFYTSPEVFELELNSVFRSSWQFVGFANRIPSAGDQLVAEIGTEPIIVVRGKDLVVRAFYNVCRHRGGPLATEDGCSSMLQCKYYGWTYTLDGMLRGVPDFDRAELFDKKDFGLAPVDIREWHGLLFVSLEKCTVSLDTLLIGAFERIHNVDLSRMQFFRRMSYTVNCNWKAYVDNYLEGYHVPIVHPELFKIYDFNSYVTETREWYSFQHSPLGTDEKLYSVWADDSRSRDALYYWIWPNLMLNLLPGRLQTNLVRPIAANKCEVIFDYYYEDITSPESLRLIEEDLKFSNAVQQEDVEICELVQRGLSSRSYNKGRFSPKRENAVYHFQCLLKRALQSG